ncbi:hypothetical protein MTR67_021689 [Solanum verrucosum]|uniref:Uncharacterized protein n=1 Tax=Solanum verrucosum TaxID=315347 RepID=A0AAF0QQI1_SOLVR|nr:hypothetical protein MTR67_021689 [Solanum verrucosum]
MDLLPVLGGKHKSLCSLPDNTKFFCRKLGLTCKVLVLLRYFKIHSHPRCLSG